jgi:UDP-4-amino-4,6-dideoxy-N-acetyl-beta-L-altrosamine transaminase
MIPYGKQHITNEDIDAVVNALKSDFLTQGPEIAKFEKAFSDYIGCSYAMAVSNGTAALHLCALALGVNKKTRVITTPITFAASANCIRYCDGEVYFADIDPETYLLDINKVRELLEKHPKGYFHGIIPVDFSGRAIDLEAFRNLADEFGCWIIEDSCHAPGGYFTDSEGDIQLCGNGKFADLAIFSFHPVKHIACGEGGMITTNDENLYHKLLKLRTHGITKDPALMSKNDGGWYYEMQDLGYNYRITDFQAALGTSQLKRADDVLKRRKEIAQIYTDAFKYNQNIKGHSGLVEGHAYHLYIIEVENRKELYDYLRSKNIFCQVHYIPVHSLPYYKNFGFKIGDFPNAEKYYTQCLSLPMYPKLLAEEQQFVIDQVNSFINN